MYTLQSSRGFVRVLQQSSYDNGTQRLPQVAVILVKIVYRIGHNKSVIIIKSVIILKSVINKIGHTESVIYKIGLTESVIHKIGLTESVIIIKS